MIIDSHQHFWDLEQVEYPWLVPAYGPIYRTFQPDELQPQLTAAGVDRTVLVQSANSFADTDAMLAQAAADGLDRRRRRMGAARGRRRRGASPRRAVSRRSRSSEACATSTTTSPTRTGWSAPAVIDGPAGAGGARAGVRGRGRLPAPPRARPDARARPARTCASSSTTWPSRPSRPGTSTPGSATSRQPPRIPTSLAKVSGLNTAADWATWTAEDLVEPIGHAIEVFGADRLMFGSDWPVAILAGDYQQRLDGDGPRPDAAGPQRRRAGRHPRRDRRRRVLASEAGDEAISARSSASSPSDTRSTWRPTPRCGRACWRSIARLQHPQLLDLLLRGPALRVLRVRR